MKYFLSIFFIIATSNSQSRIGDFQSISSFANVSSALFLDSVLVGVSESGLIFLNTEDESIKTVSIDEGLSYVGLTHIHKDRKDNLWIGSDKGIQVWDPQKNVLIDHYELDIEALSGFVNFENFIYSAAKINGLWGIIEFRYVEEKVYFRDFYQRPDLEKIHKISFFDDKIFVLSSNGLIAGNPFQNHISTWSNPLEQINGNVIDFQEDNGNLYILSSSAIHRFSFDSILIAIIDNYDFSHIKGLSVSNSNIFAYSNTSIYQIASKEISMIYSDLNLQINDMVKSDNDFWTATNFGFGRINNGIYDSFIHNQPIINNSDAIEFYNNNLIMASNYGIAIEGWANYITATLPKSISNKFQISTLSYDLGKKISKSLIREDLLFLGFTESQTAGIISLDITNSQFSVVSKYFTQISQDTSDLKYSISDMVFDRQNNLWAISSDNSNYPLSVFSKNQARHFSSRSPQNNIIDGNKSIIVDNYNRIWMSSASGLLMYSYSGDVLNPQSEEWVNIPVVDGINRNALNYAVSTNNTLWIITNYGLIYKKLRAQGDQPVVETGPITTSGSIKPYFQNVPFDQSSKIYFDPNDNLWVTSNMRGLFVLDENNEYWPSFNGINISNSNLLSNNISDIKFNDDGLAYISTDLGISKFKIPYKSEIKKTNMITIFPSPFKIPSNLPMVIDGVPQRSSIQIMSLNGNKIKTLNSNEMIGYQATWDGKNDDGTYVASGVYLVLIINKEHNTSSIEKIAVIKN